MPPTPLVPCRLAAAAACALAGVAAAGVLAGSASAQNSGGATADPGRAAKPAPAASGAQPVADTGSPAAVATPPKPLLITCRTACAGLDIVRAGGIVRVTGDGMDGARTVVFTGAKATGDEVSAPAVSVSPDAVDVVVPAGAVSGPVQVLDAAGAASRRTRKRITIASATRASSAAAVPAARVDVKKVFFRGPHRATVSVFIPDGPPQHVVVDLVRATDGVSVGHWELDGAGGTVQSASWGGVVSGNVQRDGRYRFQIQLPNAAGASAAQAAPALAPAFTFLGDMFPIRGKHTFADGVGRFGAGRSGHTHQGQDVFAACGTPLVAARGGTVKFSGFQSQAGNYVVIDGAGTGNDYVYMHLKEPSPVKKGDSVYTGEPIGEVGDTGDAVGCHLHFELWTAPGWYTGGDPVDPLPSLQAWDAHS